MDTFSLDEDARARLEKGLELLTPLQQTILEKRFGLNGSPRFDLADVESALGLSREQIRRQEAQALQRLRRSSRS
jgi:DNA-directed RNA polymerase sigma subunit (sigma70/sigma32)